MIFRETNLMDSLIPNGAPVLHLQFGGTSDHHNMTKINIGRVACHLTTAAPKMFVLAAHAMKIEALLHLVLNQ